MRPDGPIDLGVLAESIQVRDHDGDQDLDLAIPIFTRFGGDNGVILLDGDGLGDFTANPARPLPLPGASSGGLGCRGMPGCPRNL